MIRSCGGFDGLVPNVRAALCRRHGVDIGSPPSLRGGATAGELPPAAGSGGTRRGRAEAGDGVYAGEGRVKHAKLRGSSARNPMCIYCSSASSPVFASALVGAVQLPLLFFSVWFRLRVHAPRTGKRARLT